VYQITFHEFDRAGRSVDAGEIDKIRKGLAAIDSAAARRGSRKPRKPAPVAPQGPALENGRAALESAPAPHKRVAYLRVWYINQADELVYTDMEIPASHVDRSRRLMVSEGFALGARLVDADGSMIPGRGVIPPADARRADLPPSTPGERMPDDDAV
jgi:hypothetical protein